MTMSNLLSTHVVVSILVSVYSNKQRADYTTVHYIVQLATHYKQKIQMVSFLIAGHIILCGVDG